MSKKKKYKLIVVDDSDEIRDVAAKRLSVDFAVDVFADMPSCMEHLQQYPCDVMAIKADLLLGTQIDYLQILRQRHPFMQIIGMGRNAQISAVIQLIRKGMYDFIEKPFAFASLHLKLVAALEERIGKDPGHLSPCQEKIVRLILEGKTNHQIAQVMGRSIRTIEYHRASMKKSTGLSRQVDFVRFGMAYLARTESIEPQIPSPEAAACCDNAAQNANNS